MAYAKRKEWYTQIIPANPTAIPTLLDFWKPDGIVVNSASGNNNFNGSVFGKIPSVFIDRPYVSLRPCDSCIYHDSVATVRLAMRELLKLSPAACVYVSWPVPHPWNDERRRTYESILRLNGLERHVFSTKRSIDDIVEIQTELADFLATLPKPIAVLAAADQLGIHVIGACRLAGFSVPEDVAVIGIDNEEAVCETSNPSLSSVSPDHFSAGYRAAEILDGLMAGGETSPTRETYGSPTFTRRGSSLRLKRQDHDVMAAMENIRRDACNDLNAKTVLARFGCARRNAEYRFRASTGMSVAEVIRKTRYEKALSLLDSGDLPISAVADFCGYGSIAAFSRFFKSMCGISPRKYRMARNSVGTPAGRRGDSDKAGPRT